jgi:excisionase family DNA binding protein
METNRHEAAELRLGAHHGPVRLLLRPEEGAEAIGVSRARFYELMATGQIKSIKIGRSRRVPIAEIHSFIAAELAAQTA